MTRPATQGPLLFRVACGPRQGYGHLVRALRLARALRVTPVVSLRGPLSARDAARRFGAVLSTLTAAALRHCPLRLLVVDDPNARSARPWITAARGIGVPVASIHDLGLGADGADLVVDGSVRAHTRAWSAKRQVLGPRYCVLDDGFGQGRGRERTRTRGPFTVVISLGGGPRHRSALRVAQAIARGVPGARLVVAAGLAPVAAPASGARIRWVRDPAALRRACRRADVAVVGGGTSLYECCAMGTPTVAVAVVRGQCPTVRGFVDAGATRDGGMLSPASSAAHRVASLVSELLSRPAERRRLSARGRRLVDGRGLERVTGMLADLAGMGHHPRRRSR